MILLWEWKKKLSTSLFRRMQIQNKENKMTKFINTELESDWESELESDTELESKLILNSYFTLPFIPS